MLPCVAGEDVRTRLVAVTDMPRAESNNNSGDFDISVFVGPLFYLWLVQLPLPWVWSLLYCATLSAFFGTQGSNLDAETVSKSGPARPCVLCFLVFNVSFSL